MDIEGLFLLGVPLTVLVLSGYVAFVFGRDRNRRVLGGMCALWVVFTGFMFAALEGASGWDGLIYIFGLLGFSAPGGLGSLVGGILGWVKKDNDKYA
ncbi:MAG: hypothetical protein AAFP85_18635 [Pseudomonadota bacterium]